MIHAFDVFELDERRFELRKNGEVVGISPKVFDLLRCLIERHDTVVTHAELMKLLWPGVTITRDSLTQVVMLARSALGDDVEEPRFLQTVRGRGYRFAGPLSSRATSERTPAVSAPSPAPSGAGRRASLATLEERLERAREGRGGVVLLTGEAGIGKTHLAHALAPTDTSAVFVKCFEGDGAPSLWPFVQLLRRLENDGLELSGAVKELASGELGPEQLADPRSRFALFDQCVRAIVEQARRRPLLVVIDDFQRTDDHSLGLLSVLAPQARTERLLLVVLYDTTAPRLPSFGASMAAIAREPTTTTLRLGPLTREEVGEVVRKETGRDAEDNVVDRLLDKTKGNPLLLAQLVRVVRTNGEQVGTSALVGGDDLRDAVTNMLQTLAEGTLEVLSVASVFGRVFPLAPLAAALGRPTEEVLRELDSAALARVVARRADAYRFTYPLVRDVLYRRLPVADRASLHRVVADVLRVRLGDERDHQGLGEVAHHLVEAAAIGEVDAAVECSLRAVDLAREAGDAEAAARYAKRGLEAMRFAARPDHERHARLSAAIAASVR